MTHRWHLLSFGLNASRVVTCVDNFLHVFLSCTSRFEVHSSLAALTWLSGWFCYKSIQAAVAANKPECLVISFVENRRGFANRFIEVIQRLPRAGFCPVSVIVMGVAKRWLLGWCQFLWWMLYWQTTCHRRSVLFGGSLFGERLCGGFARWFIWWADTVTVNRNGRVRGLTIWELSKSYRMF